MRPWKISVSLLLSALSLCAGDFRAGVAISDVTPPPGARLWGYTARQEGAAGTLDPLGARVLYLEGESAALAWVDLDYGRTFGRDALDWVRQEVGPAVPHIFFSATHSHSGPELLETYPEGRPAWEQRVLEAIVAAILKARSSAQPVRVGFAYGKSETGYNRRLVAPDGSVRMLWDNREGLAQGPTDPTVAALRLDRADGTPLAILVNAAVHPVLRSPRDTRFSADFPGVVRRRVENAWNPGPVCFFLQGAAGDINPQVAPDSDDPVEQLGEKLASEVLRLANSIQTRRAVTGRMEVREDLALLRNRWSEVDFAGPFRAWAPYVGHISRMATLPVAVVALDHSIALAAFPGEFFIEHQLDLRKRAPLRDVLFVGYANGYYGYFPTIDAAAIGGYGANDVMAAWEAGAGEMLVNRALILMNQALGKFRKDPVAPGQPYRSTGPLRK